MWVYCHDSHAENQYGNIPTNACVACKTKWRVGSYQESVIIRQKGQSYPNVSLYVFFKSHKIGACW